VANPLESTYVLVIEDDVEDFLFVKRLLKKVSGHRYRLFHQETLEEGMAYLDLPEGDRGHRIDVVLLDLGLPDCEPKETVSNFQKYAEQYATIVITGQPEEETEDGFSREAIAMGAEDFLTKDDIRASSIAILRKTIRNAIQRKELKANIEHAQELARVGAWTLNLTSNKLDCSPFMSSIFELERGDKIDSLGRYLSMTHPRDQEKIAIALRNACASDKPLDVDHRIILDSGNIKYVSLRGHVEKNLKGIPKTVRGTTQDITDRKMVEILQQEKDLSEKSARMRQDFLARTSHEIRTPLNPILVLTNMLKQTPLNEEQREYMEIIHNAGETLLALVNDILDLAKIEAGKISFNSQPFRLERVMESISDMMEIKAREKHLQLQLKLDPRLEGPLLGDSVRLLQILLNLVGNAIKFTHAGKIVVKVKPIQEFGDEVRVRFSVKDTGIGIPKDQLQVIFGSFQQVGNPTHSAQGVGLGLSIVRQLVHLQNGTISVKSEPGQGSVFMFELPFQRAEKHQIPLEIGNKHRGFDRSKVVNLRILLVEDNPLNQMVTNKLLSDWGTKVTIANNGLEAIEALRRQPFDLILMDIQMPEMDGYEATRFIRAEMPPPIDNIPIIALTANAFSGSDDECLKVGMNDYLSKPIEIQNLFDKIVSHVPKPSRTRAMFQQPVNGHKVWRPSGEKVLSHNKNQFLTSIIPGEMNTYQYINLQPLTNLMGGDASSIKNVIQVFVQEAPGIIHDLNNLLVQRKFMDLSKLAHRLKSSAGHMGMDSLYQVSLQIEQKAKSDPNAGELTLLVGEADTLLSNAMGELKDALLTL